MTDPFEAALAAFNATIRSTTKLVSYRIALRAAIAAYLRQTADLADLLALVRDDPELCKWFAGQLLKLAAQAERGASTATHVYSATMTPDDYRLVMPKREAESEDG